jgi:alpha-glucosidase/alpha-D-xyloside xylohydrolase
MDASHILDYWRQHVGLFDAGIDAFWPDEGDWFDLFERIKRHQLYYQGPLSTRPNVRPWSLHRNGHLGVARWGGWVWSGDTDSSWRTLEAQVMVGLNHSLSLSPYWGSDTGGFYPNEELTGVAAGSVLIVDRTNQELRAVKAVPGVFLEIEL